MSNAPATMMIDDVKYVREDSIQTPAGPPTQVQIVVTEGKWNIVGNVEHHENGSLTITSARIIMYWGTTKGLGQLAASGPTSKTVLGEVGTIRVPAHSVLLCMDSKASVWGL